MTGLALLALMGGGSTPSEGPHAPAIRKGVEFLLKCQQANGLIASVTEEQRSMYGHGFAMLALAEAYGAEEDAETRARIHRALGSAVSLTQRSQSGDGGWNYTPGSRGDEGSVTITQLQALRAARNAGIKVPKSVIDGVVGYIEKAQNGDGGIRYRVNHRGGSLPAISAAALCCLYCAGIYEGDAVEKLLSYVKQRVRPGLAGGHAFYMQYYMGQAMWMAGEEHWKEYRPELFRQLLASQSGDGSWSDGRVGSTYATAIACVLLQLPYRHLPILDR
jgi:hypothetical protein